MWEKISIVIAALQILCLIGFVIGLIFEKPQPINEMRGY